MAYDSNERERFFREDWPYVEEALADVIAHPLGLPDSDVEVMLMHASALKLTRIIEILHQVIRDDMAEIAELKSINKARMN